MASSPNITLVSETDLAVATYRYVVDTAYYNQFSLHTRLVSDDADNTVTLTVLGSNDPDADGTADTGRLDISTTVVGGASLVANNATVENLDFVTTIKPRKYMVKVVVANTGALGNTVKARVNLNKS